MIRVKRVRWYTDRLRRIRTASKELLRATLGHMHDDATILFEHKWGGYVAANKCRICGRVIVHGSVPLA